MMQIVAKALKSIEKIIKTYIFKTDKMGHTMLDKNVEYKKVINNKVKYEKKEIINMEEW